MSLMRNIELILQSDPGENAPAALAMILACHGRRVTLRELTGRGMESAADLVSAARAYGLQAGGYNMTARQAAGAPMPLIAHWQFRSFVVVTAVRAGRVYVNSPEDGRLVMTEKEFAAGFTGAVVCFASQEGQAGEKRKRAPDGRLGKYPAATAVLAVLEAAGWTDCAAVTLLMRELGRRLTSPGVTGGPGLCLATAGAVLLQLGLAALQYRQLNRRAERQSGAALAGFRERLESEDSSFFRETSFYRLGLVCDACADVPFAMARESFCLLRLLTGAVCVLLIAAQSLASAAAALILYAAFAAAVRPLCRERYGEMKLAERDWYLRYGRFSRDAAQWKELRLTGHSRRRFHRWISGTNGAARAESQSREGLLWAGFAGAELLAAGVLCLAGAISAGGGMEAFLGCLYLSGVLSSSMAALPEYLTERMRIRSAGEEAERVFDGPAGTSGRRIPRPDTIALQNASVKGGRGPDPIVKGVTFTVRRGEIMAVSCPAGGQRALSRVLAGLEPPVQGTMYIGSESSGELGEKEAVRHVRLIGEGLPFPEGTVRENISAGRSLTDYSVMEAASDAGLHRSVLLRESGDDARADTLSEGERVLLEFACAFAAGIPFIVAGDVTRALDAGTAGALVDSVRRRGVGAVFLTDDPAVTDRADMVCRIENGRAALPERTGLSG